MNYIELNHRQVSIVDDGDFEWLNRFTWHAKLRSDGRGFYADHAWRLPSGRVHHIRMHRMLLKTPVGQRIDHVDGDSLNNQRANLRFCTASENGGNARLNRNNRSGFKGVFWRWDCCRWRVSITVEHRKFCVGHFSTLLEAAQAYDEAAVKFYGEFARTNRTLGLYASDLPGWPAEGVI